MSGSGPESTPPVSVLIFTLDEEKNLPGCLDSLRWCDDVTVIDSFSTDGTLGICESRGIPWVQHEFRGFGTQRNWALENVPIAHDWVLVLDADERVPESLASELCAVAISAPPSVGAYRVRRRFHMWGRWLRYSSLYPTWVVRFINRHRVRYVDRGHAETQRVDGEIGELAGFLIDDNAKSIAEWFERQNRYSTEDARYELQAKEGDEIDKELTISDPLSRRTVLKRFAAELPFRGTLFFLYCYVFRLGFLDGRDGFMFCRMKAMYYTMVSIKKYDSNRH